VTGVLEVLEKEAERKNERTYLPSQNADVIKKTLKILKVTEVT
jgi:hypothetical protein